MPGAFKGSDFTQFEIKTIQVKFTKRDGLVRTCGDTPIADLTVSKNFESSNVWNKIKSVVSVLVYNDVIIDILYFNGGIFKSQLESDYFAMLKGENNHTRKDGKTWRQVEGKKNKYLARKDFKNSTSSVMMMGSQMIELSNSISKSSFKPINDQNTYLTRLLTEKINFYKSQFKKTGIGLLNKLTLVSNIEELIKYRDLINQKLDKMYKERICI